MFAPRSYEGILESVYHQQEERHADLLTTTKGTNNAAVRNLDVSIAMDKVEAHDEETQNSGSGTGSGLSDLSALENETDEFGRLLLQHERDARRMNNVLRGGREQAFRKARPKQRVAERLEREERERLAQHQPRARSHERTSSGGSNESEPHVTVPREWGRKARRQNNWMKKIVAPSEEGDNATVDNNGDAIYTLRTTYTGDLNWRNNADQPLQSIENTPPSKRRQTLPDTPSSLNHMNTTLKPGIDSDDNDFTASSILASTPAPPQYHRKIDELAARELEQLESQAVTTRTLDQIDQRSQNATLRRTSSSRLRERAVADGMRSPLASPELAPIKSPSPSRIPVRRHYFHNKENVVPLNGHINGGVIGGRDAERNTPLGKPGHARNDSMNLLRKLARVSSMSPSPARTKSGGGEGDARPRTAPVGVKVVHVDVEGSGGADAESAEDAYHHARGREAERKVDGKPNGIENEREVKLEEAAPSAFESQEPHDAKDLLTNGTHGTETTMNGRVELLDEDVKPAQRISNPRSALEAIMREAKDDHENQLFGESTMQSLEDMVQPDLDPSDPTITFDYDPTALAQGAENLDVGKQLTQAEKDRRQEDLAMEALNKHLRTARTSIKDANRGLRRVEKKIGEETTIIYEEDPIPTSPPVSQLATQHPASCPTCGGHQTSVWKSLYVEFRSCFYTYTTHPASIFHIHLTSLGMACVIFMAWYITESLLCEYFCQPQFAYTMVGYGVDPDAPEFPFVIPTLALRPFRWVWRPVLDVLGEMMEVGVVAYFSSEAVTEAGEGEREGIMRGFAERTVSVADAWAGTASRVAWSVVQAAEEVGSMWNDEVM